VQAEKGRGEVAWRLENAILTERKGKVDYFLGHGSGRQTRETMKKKLSEEYNAVIGLHDPDDLSKMNFVKRPIESR
jgi:hypothetical protein